ncbi:MAG: chorismate mutase [Angelakisella sp.]
MELDEARKRLNKIDSGLLELLEHRMEVVSHIAQYKENHGLPVRDPAREEEIIASVAQQVDEEMVPYAVRFTEMILELSRDYQTERRKNNGKNR